MSAYRDLTFAFLGAACGIKLGIELGRFLYQRQRRGVERYYTVAGGVFLANRM